MPANWNSVPSSGVSIGDDGSIRFTSEKLNCMPAICPAKSSISFSIASASPYVSPTASSPRIALKLISAWAFGSEATSGASRNATASTNTALARTGSADEEKNGAKSTIPLTRIRASVIALKNVVQSFIASSR